MSLVCPVAQTKNKIGENKRSKGRIVGFGQKSFIIRSLLFESWYRLSAVFLGNIILILRGYVETHLGHVLGTHCHSGADEALPYLA